ncbi:Uncharacterized conserved protein YjgD, DUF1641 family [Bacillus sp. OV322]|uniref:DUF1641 domain-containing protein n=1 Tax=Bacillus sp. OV322 TaxID=1882764 RepID=UPI0008E8E0C9|nr:DUF1641 domain-containing protein [Bacillus sp. OV322]SFC69896.1 Uncharacterized conserved protein YjgD, DUF1641 family [Bacillus sp. OV322]
MAEPITYIKKTVLTKEEQRQQKLEDLTALLAENDDSLNKIMGIIGELNDIGVLQAAHSMISAKEKIAQIGLEQITREPVTNLINTLMGATGALMSADSEAATKLVKGAVAGMDSGSDFLKSNQKIKIRDLMKVMNDPDINRTLGFGIHFLRGMGKELKN